MPPSYWLSLVSQCRDHLNAGPEFSFKSFATFGHQHVLGEERAEAERIWLA
jgi:hypothetical protein